MKHKLNAIFARGLKREFALADGSLPWKKCPDLSEESKKDMAHFKANTMDGIVIMGFNTYGTFAAPLPGRINVVIDRTKENAAAINEDRFNYFSSLEAALDFFSDEKYSDRKLFLIGGAKLYAHAFENNLIDGTIYETIFNRTFSEATVFMPEVPAELEGKLKTLCLP